MEQNVKNENVEKVYCSGKYILPEILKKYNNTKHSSIKMTPTDASKKEN